MTGWAALPHNENEWHGVKNGRLFERSEFRPFSHDRHSQRNGSFGRIMTCAAGDNGTEIVQNLEKALQAKPTMLSKSEISKQNAAWKKKYGYKNPKKEKTKNVKAASA